MEEEILENEELFERMQINVDLGQSPYRIDKFILERMMGVSRNRIQSAISDGAVLVNGKTCKSNYKVRPNDEISLLIPRHSKSEGVLPENIELDIRYEDDDLMVTYKPSGMVVHPGVGNRSGTLVNALAYYFEDKELPIMEGNESDRPGLVHRIDKGTSGLLLIAKNSFTMSHLAKQFFDHKIEREYQAIVWGNFDEMNGVLDGRIGMNLKDRTKRMVYVEDEGGKHAITHYSVIEDLFYVSLIKCRLETGRTHQIRVHMSHARHPVFNDDKYGGDKIVKGTVFSKYRSFVENNFKLLPRLALHAKSLGFIHPRTEEKMIVDSDLPEDMQMSLERWRTYLGSRKK